MALVVYQDEAEALLFSGPTRLAEYSTVGRMSVWLRSSMSANAAVGLVSSAPDFGHRLRAACERYSLVLPPRPTATVPMGDGGDDVLLRDPYACLRSYISQWLQFAELCARLALIVAPPPSLPPDAGRRHPALQSLVTASLRDVCGASVEEYAVWLRRLELAVEAALARRRVGQAQAPTRRRAAEPEPDSDPGAKRACFGPPSPPPSPNDADVY